MNSVNDHCYVGFKSCGHMVTASVDDPKYAKDTAEVVAKWIKRGLRVERVSVERARAELHFCKCGQQKGKQVTA